MLLLTPGKLEHCGYYVYYWMKVDENICGATFYLKSGTYISGTYQAEPKEALPIRRLLCQRTAEGEILKYKLLQLSKPSTNDNHNGFVSKWLCRWPPFSTQPWKATVTTEKAVRWVLIILLSWFSQRWDKNQNYFCRWDNNNN